jgi:hypothetical protein
MDDDDFDGTIPGRRFRLIDLAVLAANVLDDLASTAETATGLLVQLTAQHANWLNDREKFHEQAALEIEALTRGVGEWDARADP